jgi:eukaryotic-like serine/threonine-protein kinase
MSGLLHKIGDVIGDRYEIEGYVGAGGMQEVYRANDKLLSRAVALKAPKNKSAEKRFKRSAVVSARVNHANVAKTLDYLEIGNRSYLIEEFIDGVDLGQLVKEIMPILDPLLVARLFHHLAKGLAASHHADVVHRDLKPSNILAVGGELLADVKITDFGIAKLAAEELAEAVENGDSSITASQTAVGALPYMAPEMIESFKDAAKPADIWSLGAMIYELLVGTKPFGTGLKAVPAILEGKYSPLPSSHLRQSQFKTVADETFSLVKKCLVVATDKRPTADELVQLCEKLCYPVTEREFGFVTKFDNSYWGFITPDVGKSVFFHVESVFGQTRLQVGDRVYFARHKGGGSDRAFPVVRVRVPAAA